MDFQEVVLNGPLLLAVMLSLVAGTVSFASPCVVPLVPGYMAYLAGLVGGSASADGDVEGSPLEKWKAAGAAALFVAGFSVVFAAGLATFLGVSGALLEHEKVLQRLGGVVTVGMGFGSWDSPSRSNASSGSTRCRASESPELRCWERSSASAGRRVSAPRSPVSPRWSSERPAMRGS